MLFFLLLLLSLLNGSIYWAFKFIHKEKEVRLRERERSDPKRRLHHLVTMAMKSKR